MSKGKTGSRLITLLLAVLMLVAYMPLLGEAAYAAEPQLQTDKTEYVLGEPIMVTVNTDISYTWVGMYGRNEDPTDNDNYKSILWRDGYTNGEAFDLASPPGDGHGKKNREYGAGDYKVILFGDDGFSNEVEVINITITEPKGQLQTDKTEYELGEAITVTADSDGEKDWVALFKKGDTLASSTPCFHWYYVKDHKNEAVNLLDQTVGNPPRTDFGPGEYRVILLENDGYSVIRSIDITIKGKPGTIAIDDADRVYKYGDPIKVTATSNYPNAWVGFYPYNGGDPLWNGDLMAHYKLSDASSDTVDIFHDAIVEDKEKLENLEDGKYKVILFTDGWDIDRRENGNLCIESFSVYHPYTLDEWIWYSEAGEMKAYATFVGEGAMDVTAAVTSETTAPTCETAGKIVYTATIDNDAVEAAGIHFTEGEAPFTDTKEVAGDPATGHKYGAAEYTWSEDNSKCTAKMVCENDATHVVEETVEAKAETTAPTCDAAGKIVYTATFENAAFEAQTKEVAGDPATGHKYGAPEYTWSEDNSKCTAKMVCEKDATHVVEETVEAKAETTAPTCEAAGKTVYTATFENEAFEAQSKEVAIEATGHTPDEAVEENKVDSTCTAEGSYDEVVYCKECKAEISRTQKTIEKKAHTPAEAVKEDGEDASCEAAGFHFDVVKCSVCGEEISRTKVEDPALGHDYQVVEGSAKAATFEEAGKEADKKCSRCGDVITGAEIPKLTAEASLSKTKFHYTGKVQKPEVKVAVNGTELDPKDFEVTIPSSKKIGAYKVTVKTTGDYAGFETTLNYQIAPKKVALKSVTKGTKSFTAKWAKQSATARKNIGGFQLRYSKDKTFKKGVYLSKKLSNKTTKWVKKGLKKKTKYYVQIRTYKKVNGNFYYSDWSKYKIVTTR